MSNHINLYYLNVRSVCASLDYLKELIVNNHIDILCVGETWLGNKINNQSVLINNYSLIREGRIGRSGGVGSYIPNDISYKKVEYSLTIEQCWIEVMVNNDVGYRAPNVNGKIFINDIETTLSLIVPKFSTVIYGGDFNFNLSDTTGLLPELLLEVSDSFNASQLVKEWTRISQFNSSLLDYVFTTNPDIIANVKINVANISDHQLVQVDLKFNRTSQEQFFTRSFKNIDHQQLTSDINLNILYQLRTVDEKANFLF